VCRRIWLESVDLLQLRRFDDVLGQDFIIPNKGNIGRMFMICALLIAFISQNYDKLMEVPNKSSCTFLIRKFQTGVHVSIGAYFTVYVAYTKVYLVYIKACKF